jgi:hypothetical protein
LIDYLQEWNFDKKLEAFGKSSFLRKNIKMISAINPKDYKKRFDQNILRNYFSFNQMF